MELPEYYKYYAATYAPETQRWVRESRPAATKCVGYFHRRKTQLKSRPCREDHNAEYFFSSFAAVLLAALNYLQWLGYLFRFSFFFKLLQALVRCDLNCETHIYFCKENVFWTFAKINNEYSDNSDCFDEKKHYMFGW